MVELMCACAAYDFFTLDESNLQNTTAQYLYRSVELDGAKNMTFRGVDFVSATKESEFMQKLGSFLTLSHIVLSKHGGALPQESVKKEARGTRGFVERLKQFDMHDYDEMPEAQCKEIDDYMKEFAYSANSGRLVRGWIYQVYNSVRQVGVSHFLFPVKVFEENVRALEAMDPCKAIQEEKKDGLLFKTDKRTDYDDFVKNLSGCRPDGDKQNVSTIKERFLAHMFNAINNTIPFSARIGA